MYVCVCVCLHLPTYLHTKHSNMYFKLVLNEPRKALAVLELYEEAGVQPRSRTLRYLAKVLQSENIDVPFKIPTEPDNRPQRTVS